MDDQKGFLGAMDRWDFKLIGKKEKYITYNNFALFDRKQCSTAKQLSTKSFVNPDCVRWELHRVWVVEATLKPGLRHVYKKRVFFWDEDAPGTGIAENYDASGKLYRLMAPVNYPFYEAPGGVGGLIGSGVINTDLQTGIAAMTGLGGCEINGYSCGWYVGPDRGNNYYSPEGMAGEGIR